MEKLPDIPGYRLLRRLKESKRSSIFLAEQQSLARQVALRVLAEEFFDDPGLRQRFIDEGKSAARLNHPNVLAVFDIGSANGFPFIATEFVPGGTLRERLQRPMAPVEALRIARDLASALDYAHSQGVLHSDIKPSNILFRSDGTAVLADLGILRSQSGETGLQAGSPHYMSPEQIEGLVGDVRADLYSLGIVLFEMLTGRPPFDADDPFAVIAKHLSEPVPRLPESVRSFQGLIDRTLAKKPEQRFAAAGEFVQAVDAFLDPKAARDAKVGEGGKPGRPRREPPPAAVPAQAPAPASGPAETMVQPAVPAPSGRVSSLRPPTAPKGDPTKALLRILLVLVVLIALAYGAWLGVRALLGADDGARQQPSTSTVNRQLAGTQGNVDADLARAERLLASRQWISPPGDNALAAFDAVLAVDRDNVRAKEGLARVAQALKTELRALVVAGKAEEASELMERARIAFPEDEELATIQAEISALRR